MERSPSNSLPSQTPISVSDILSHCELNIKWLLNIYHARISKSTMKKSSRVPHNGIPEFGTIGKCETCLAVDYYIGGGSKLNTPHGDPHQGQSHQGNEEFFSEISWNGDFFRVFRCQSIGYEFNFVSNLLVTEVADGDSILCSIHP